MSLENRMEAFVRLGLCMQQCADGQPSLPENTEEVNKAMQKFADLIPDVHHWNAWFVPENVRYMVGALATSLRKESLEQWISGYPALQHPSPAAKTVAVIMAGNIPMVGFHDFLSVLISGHKVLAKLSSDDDQLLPALADLLMAIQPDFSNRITFTKEKLPHFDAVIATGSNNTSRYFEYYFAKYPHIIRKNRNGVAILNGTEDDAQLHLLSDDVFMYFGLGCRNVSKIYLPEGYQIPRLLDVLSQRTQVTESSKYFNNYEYAKAIYLVNGRPHFDAGNLLMVADEQIPSPISVLNYEYYDDLDILNDKMKLLQDQIQCIVSNTEGVRGAIAMGNSQKPSLWDYADGVDTLAFLSEI